MEVTATYNDGSTKKVTNYTVLDGNSLTEGKTKVSISYEENGITKTAEQEITVVAKLRVTVNKYSEVLKNNKNYMCQINPNTTLEEIKNSINTNGTIIFYKKSEEIKNLNTKVATGVKLKIALYDEIYEGILVVKGDINGDGDIDFINDIIMLNNYRLNRIQLDTEFILAGDIDGNKEIDFINDIIKINDYRLNRIKSL